MKTSEFLDKVGKSGFFRPNKFKVLISPPGALAADMDALEVIELNAKVASLPGRNFETKVHEQGGQFLREHVHSVRFSDCALTFNLSRDQLEKTLFDDWQSLVYTTDGQLLSYFDEYVGVLSVYPLNNSGEEIERYDFFDVYPKLVAEVPLSMDENNTISSLQVTFSYHHWKKEKV